MFNYHYNKFVMNKPKQKRVPHRHQPKGITILHEDRDILVVNKSAGLLTVGTERVKTNTVYYLLTNYVRKGSTKSRKQILISKLLSTQSHQLQFGCNSVA